MGSVTFFPNIKNFKVANVSATDKTFLYSDCKSYSELPVWKFCPGASQAPTRKNRAPTWVSRQDQTANETPNPTKAYLMTQFGPNLATFIL